MSYAIDHRTITATPPRVIHVTITEEDRQKADSFCSTGGCILATALTRMGYSHFIVGVDDAHIGFIDYEIRHNGRGWGADESCRLSRKERPFYSPGVVGKTI